MKVKVTAEDGGMYHLWADGKQISRHTQEREAMQAGLNALLGGASEVYFTRKGKVTLVLDPPSEPPVEPDPDPEAVIDLRVVSVEDHRIVVQWTAVDDGTGHPASSRLRYGSPDMPSWGGAEPTDTVVEGVEIGDTIEYVLTGLESESDHELVVQTFRDNDDGTETVGGFSNKVEATTTGEGEPPVEPEPEPEPDPEPVDPVPDPPVRERPSDALFFDEPGATESGPQGAASWKVPSIADLGDGKYAARARHSASKPGVDIGSGPTEKRFRVAEVDGSEYTRLEMERDLFIPETHYHTWQLSGPILLPDGSFTDHRDAFSGLELIEGTDVVRASRGIFHSSSKGMAVAFPGAGLPGDDGLAAYIVEVISPTEARLTGMCSYRLDEGKTDFSRAANGTYTEGPLSDIPVGVKVDANKIHRAMNHKHLAMWGREYSSRKMPHPHLVAERWAHRNYRPGELVPGDSSMTVKAYIFGPNGNTGAQTIGSIPAVVSHGPGWHRGFWNRERWVMDLGPANKLDGGSIIVEVNGERLVDAHGLRLRPTPYTDGRSQLEPYQWLDAGYLDGWINGGFMQDSDHLTRNFILRAS